MDDETTQFPFISVVIITYNSARTLADCLDSIRGTDYPPDRYELLIVDGGSSDETLSIAATYRASQTLSCPRGRSLARNLGIQASKGQIIAFTDADCTVGRNWLALHAANHTLEQDVVAVGGPIVDGQTSSMGHATHICMFGGLTEKSPRRDVDEIPTSNMSLKREVSELVGLFDTRLDGIKGAASEDTELCWRIVNAGHRIVFDPALKVWHYPNYDPNNSARSHLWKQVDMGKIHFRLLRLNPHFPGRLPSHPVLIAFLLVHIAALRATRQILKGARFATPRDIAPGALTCLILQAAWWSLGYLMASLAVRRKSIDPLGPT